MPDQVGGGYVAEEAQLAAQGQEKVVVEGATGPRTVYVPGGASDTSDTRTKTTEAASAKGSECPTTDPTTIGQPPALAFESNILARFGDDIERLGVAGEQRIAKVNYLALTSRVLPWGRASERPVSAITKGTSSSGKSFTTGAVVKFFPDGTVLELTSSSRLFLLYTEKPLRHKFVFVSEWSVIAEHDELVGILRVLVSEGHIRHGTVEGNGRKEARELYKEGPTGLIMTTTAASTDTELETRCLSLRTDDSPEQTRRIFAAIAALEETGESLVDFAPWHELQLWIEAQDNRVVVPFVSELGRLMPTSATRLRRDFVSMICLVRAHAILHQATRERDSDGRIIATLGDYAAVRDLIGDLVAEGADAHVPDAIRETVEAVQAIVDDGAEHATPKGVTDRLGIGRGASYDRIKRALFTGYLIDIAKENEKGKRLKPGAPLPDQPEFLPSVADIEALVRSLSDSPSDTANPMPERDSDVLSECRTCPTTPLEEEQIDLLAEATA